MFFESDTAIRLLHVDTSPQREASTSRELSRCFVDSWLSVRPDDIVTYRDYALAPPPQVSSEWVVADATEATARTTAQHDVMRFSHECIRDLLDADLLVLGTPVHNWTVPANLKAWIDQVTREGLTFASVGDDYRPLLTDKRAVVLRASTSDLSAPRWKPLDHHAPYIRTALAFIGIDDVEVISASTEAPPSTDQALKRIDQLTGRVAADAA